jgi:hypothetical protein
VAEDAVICEPVSAANSLLTGKLTGNFAKSGHPSQFARPINARSQSLTSQFPTQQNREISNAYQGIFFGEQGNLIKQSSKSEAAGLWRRHLVCGRTEFMRAPNVRSSPKATELMRRNERPLARTGLMHRSKIRRHCMSAGSGCSIDAPISASVLLSPAG